jgi:gamma-butyrobetaine dioxygenase
MVAEVGDRFGHVRVTNYGRVFDVISVPDPNNLAYTDRALAVHTDNPYRDPCPGVQLLHCLLSEAPGGENILVDGLRAAETLRRVDGAAFDLLTRFPQAFRFVDEDSDLQAHQHVIALDSDGRVAGVHFNERSAAPIDLPVEAVESWYHAYRRFAEILRAPEGEVRVRLDPGELLMMLNQRVLHGRAAFDAGAGRRHLQGCYIDRDGIESRWRVLARTGHRAP